ncbi:MAG: hypothetical protein UR12_C0033G0015 [candidate division TM6 bacterium GW2011_GWF2_30_66]|jgi:hypothetical protein|nr:MAG: hypothetical protein UR12_C0033G0015 [candidate division TM6 bacterium GW2011_GWF2_30_66]
MLKLSTIIKSLLVSSTFILSTILNSINIGPVVGAGTLPYVIEKTNGKTKVFFLMGREGLGKFKKTWSDFGGKGLPGEETYQVASREGSEELMNIISNKYILSKIKNATRVGNTFIINIEDKVGHNPTKYDREKFIKILNKERKKLLLQKPKPVSLIEKDKFIWWRKKDLINAIKNDSKILRPGLKSIYGQPQNIQILQNIK